MNIERASVVVAAGRIARVVLIEGELVDVAWVDNAGRIIRRQFHWTELRPFRDAMRPRSLWPDSHEGGDDVRTRAQNRNSRKPRTSKRAKSN